MIRMSCVSYTLMCMPLYCMSCTFRAASDRRTRFERLEYRRSARMEDVVLLHVRMGERRSSVWSTRACFQSKNCVRGPVEVHRKGSWVRSAGGEAGLARCKNVAPHKGVIDADGTFHLSTPKLRLSLLGQRVVYDVELLYVSRRTVVEGVQKAKGSRAAGTSSSAAPQHHRQRVWTRTKRVFDGRVYHTRLCANMFAPGSSQRALGSMRGCSISLYTSCTRIGNGSRRSS